MVIVSNKSGIRVCESGVFRQTPNGPAWRSDGGFPRRYSDIIAYWEIPRFEGWGDEAVNEPTPPEIVPVKASSLDQYQTPEQRRRRSAFWLSQTKPYGL